MSQVSSIGSAMSILQEHETVGTIARWQEETFLKGQPFNATGQMIRAMSELAELASAVMNEQSSEKVLDEIADVYIVIAGLPGRWAVNWRSTRQELTRQPGHSVNLDIVLALVARFDMALLATPQIDRAAQAGLSVQTNIDMFFGPMLWFLHLLAMAYTGQRPEDGGASAALQTVVDAKMAVNRKREWGIDKAGRFHHTGVKP